MRRWTTLSHKANKTPLPPRLKGKLRVLGGVLTPLKEL
ncbi:hypothetical protein HAL07_15830 [Helicobacter ailurogastricus]|uniref:Uncharacterized protein n=1 Tax=Helicobacter ailurogastricus TaxID=1578720 RepID=A0A0K2Y2C9_9HELI|nr:hypothetical protein HAL07_15830 [Helicobacter ailurogastricus]